MEENTELLQYIYHEDLYLIDEPEEKVNVTIEHQEEIKSDVKAHEAPLVEEAKAITFFGNNEKKILILVNDPANDFLNQNELKFLMSIIEGGLKMSKVDFALVNCEKYPTQQIVDEIAHDYLISFDENEISLQKSKYQVIDKDGKKLLFAERLSVIEATREKKKQLWTALKSMFSM
jgi:hypothetical protein